MTPIFVYDGGWISLGIGRWVSGEVMQQHVGAKLHDAADRRHGACESMSIGRDTAVRHQPRAEATRPRASRPLC